MIQIVQELELDSASIKIKTTGGAIGIINAVMAHRYG